MTKSVGVYVAAKVLELRHTIKLIQFLDEEINSPMESIPGISFRLAAVIESEICDFQKFSSPDKILAFAGLLPTTYQSGKFTSQNSAMEKRGSRYLRCTLFLAAHLIRYSFKNFCYLLEEKACRR